MNHLLRLYPRIWRERYGDELLAFLEERPASFVDHFDLARGAFDAHLHPQLSHGAADEGAPAMNPRAPGLLLILGGLFYVLGVAQFGLQPLPSLDGYRDFFFPVLTMEVGVILVMCGLLTATVDRRGGAWLATDTWLATAGVVGAFVSLIPIYPIFFLGIFAVGIVCLVAGVRFLRAAAWPPALVIGLVGAFVLAWAHNSEDDRVWLLAPIGALALLIGLWIVARPASAPTLPTGEPA